MTPEEKAASKREKNRLYHERLRQDPERYARRIAKTREWQNENPEAYLRYKRMWNERHPDYYKEWHAAHPNYYVEYRAKNREALAAYAREWRAKTKAKQPLKPCLECGQETRNAKYCSKVCSGKASQKKR